MKFQFRNMRKSELAEQVAQERLDTTIEKFPELQRHKISVTFSMENSPQQPGPDHFTVRLQIHGEKFRNVILQKSGPNLYLALAELVDHAQERLARFSEKKRARERHSEREFAKTGTES